MRHQINVKTFLKKLFLVNMEKTLLEAKFRTFFLIKNCHLKQIIKKINSRVSLFFNHLLKIIFCYFHKNPENNFM